MAVFFKSSAWFESKKLICICSCNIFKDRLTSLEMHSMCCHYFFCLFWFCRCMQRQFMHEVCGDIELHSNISDSSATCMRHCMNYWNNKTPNEIFHLRVWPKKEQQLISCGQWIVGSIYKTISKKLMSIMHSMKNAYKPRASVA